VHVGEFFCSERVQNVFDLFAAAPAEVQQRYYALDRHGLFMKEAEQQALDRQLGIQKLVIFDGCRKYFDALPIFDRNAVWIAKRHRRALYHQAANPPAPLRYPRSGPA